jgi:hypothetical protein
MPVNTEKFQVTIYLNELEGKDIGNMGPASHFHQGSKRKLIEFNSSSERELFLKKFRYHSLKENELSERTATFLELPDGSFVNYLHVTRVEKGNI